MRKRPPRSRIRVSEYLKRRVGLGSVGLARRLLEDTQVIETVVHRVIYRVAD